MALRRYFGKISPLAIGNLVGHNGELVIDETTDYVYVMDGVTPGGQRILYTNVNAAVSNIYANVNPSINNYFTLGNASNIWSGLYVTDIHTTGNLFLDKFINPTATNNNWGNLNINASRITANSIYTQSNISTDGVLNADVISANSFIEINTANYSGIKFKQPDNSFSSITHTYATGISALQITANTVPNFTAYGNNFNTFNGYTQFYQNVYITGNNLTVPTNTTIGLLPSFNPTGAKLTHVDNVNSYAQFLLQNKSNGTNASGDIVVTADNGTDSTHYIDMGINSSTFSGGGGLDGPDDGYLLVEGGKLVVGTLTSGKDIVFAIGGDYAANELGRFKSGNGLVVTGNVTASGNVNIAGNLIVTGNIVTRNYETIAQTEYANSIIASGNITASGYVKANTINFGGRQRIYTTDTAGNNSITVTANIDNDINGFSTVEGTYAAAQVYSAGNIYLYTATDGSAPTWTFDINGILTVPGPIVSSTGTAAVLSYSDGNQQFFVDGDGAFVQTSFDGINYNTWTFGKTGILTLPYSNYIESVDTNLHLGAGDDIVIRSNAGDQFGLHAWTFGKNGNLTVPGNISISGNIVPTGNAVYSLGTLDHQWKSLYVSNNTIYIGGTAIQVANGSLIVGGNVVSGSGSTYGNSNVAAYLPTNSTITGINANITAANSAIATLTSNAATQATNLATLTTNAASQANSLTTLNDGLINLAAIVSQIQAGSGFATTQQIQAANSSISTLNANLNAANLNISALQSNTGTIASNVNILFTNAASQASDIIILYTNAATQASNLATLTTNAATQASDITILYSNAATQANLIALLNANVTGANSAIVTSNSAVTAYINSLNSAMTANITAANANLGTLTGRVTVVEGNIVSINNILLSIINGAFSYSNANVATYLPTYSGNLTAGNVVASGNIGATYYIGNGSALTGMYGNTQVATYLPTYSGNSNAAFFTGNGYYLTGLPATYGNTQVSAYYVANTVATSNVQILRNGNIRLATGASISDSYSPGFLVLSPNTAVDALAGVVIGGSGYLLSPNGSRNAVLNYGSVSGQFGIYQLNVYGNQQNAIVNGGGNNYGNIGSISTFFGNAFVSNIYSPNYLYPNGTSILAGVSGTFGNTQVGYYLNSNVITSNITIQGNINTIGNVYATNVTATNTFNVGNITTTGTAGNLTGSGYVVAGNLVANTNVYANGFYWLNNGAAFSSSTYSNATVAAYLPTYTGNLTAGNITVTGNITHPSNSYILGDFTNSTVAYRTMFQTANVNSSTGIYALPSGSSTAASWQAANSTNPTNASKILIATNGSTDVQLVSGINGTGTYLPLSFYNNGAAQIVLYPNGNVYMSNANPITTTGNVSVGNLITSTGGYVYGNAAVGTLTSAANGVGYMGMPQNSQSGSTYAVAIGDAGKHLYFTAATVTATIPANSSVAFPVGTTIAFIANASTTLTIAITTDTMYLAGTGTTGSRTLAAYGMATAVKVASTTWFISGTGLT